MYLKENDPEWTAEGRVFFHARCDISKPKLGTDTIVVQRSPCKSTEFSCFMYVCFSLIPVLFCDLLHEFTT